MPQAPRPFKQVTVIFGENKLQKTFKIEYDTSANTAQELGMVEIRKHLDKLERENGMPHFELDPQCTDFFPALTPNIKKVGDISGNITIVVWPAEDPVSKLTPSPLVDALTNASLEVRRFKSERAAESLMNDSPPSTDSKKKKSTGKAKQPVPSITAGTSKLPASSEPEPSLGEIMARLLSVERDNAEIKEDNAEIKKENTKQNKKIAELETELSTMRQALIGDRTAINKIRQRILLDLARDKLATLCGYKDWSDWRAHVERPTMAASARESVLANLKALDLWKNLAQRPEAFDFLVSENTTVRLQGDFTAHKSEEGSIAESIFSQPEGSQIRSLMSAIFTACFEHPPSVEAFEGL